MTNKVFIGEIKKGNYVPHSLWCLISSKDKRDGYALKMISFEGEGEYQRIEVNNMSYLIKSNVFDAARRHCPKCYSPLRIKDTATGEKYLCVCGAKLESRYDKPFKETI